MVALHRDGSRRGREARTGRGPWQGLGHLLDAKSLEAEVGGACSGLRSPLAAVEAGVGVVQGERAGGQG